MFGILEFLACLAFAAYAKNKGRHYGWGALPLFLKAGMLWYVSVAGGPDDQMLFVYAAGITLLLYYIAGQAKVAAEKEKANEKEGG